MGLDVTLFGAAFGSSSMGRAEEILMRTGSAIVLVLVGWLQSARADEPHTFWGKTVEQWLAVYRDKASTEVQRRQAVQALGCFGPEGGVAVPDLIEAARRDGSRRRPPSVWRRSARAPRWLFRSSSRASQDEIEPTPPQRMRWSGSVARPCRHSWKS
jgi:hypothetical protein